MIALVRRHTFISCLQTQALFLLYRWSCSSWPYYWFSWSQEHTHVFQQQFVKLCAHCWLSTMSLLTGQLCTCGTCVDRELHQYQALSHPFVNREACHSSWAFETRCTHPREWDGGGWARAFSLSLDGFLKLGFRRYLLASGWYSPRWSQPRRAKNSWPA